MQWQPPGGRGAAGLAVCLLAFPARVWLTSVGSSTVSERRLASLSMLSWASASKPGREERGRTGRQGRKLAPARNSAVLLPLRLANPPSQAPPRTDVALAARWLAVEQRKLSEAHWPTLTVIGASADGAAAAEPAAPRSCAHAEGQEGGSSEGAHGGAIKELETEGFRLGACTMRPARDTSARPRQLALWAPFATPQLHFNIMEWSVVDSCSGRAA